MKIAITNRCPDLPLPERASEHSAGFDLRAAVDEPMMIGPGQRALVATGVAVGIPEGFEGQVRPRSGLAWNHGVSIVNAPGTIDADYRGEIQVILINHSSEPFTVRRGERIAQLVIAPVLSCELVQVENLPSTSRGRGGFGSSGIN